MKKSKIHNLTKEEFQKLVSECQYFSDILRKLGLYVSSGNYRPLKRRLDDDQINYSHIKSGYGANKGKKFPQIPKIPLSEIIVENSNYNNSHLKTRLIKLNLLINKCILCGQEPFWHGLPLTLQLDHINGNHRDNRLENLRILCPHCHTQTATYGSKNIKHTKEKTQHYCICGKPVSKKDYLANHVLEK